MVELNPADAVHKLAEDLTEGMVLKAAIVYDYVDPEGNRRLGFALTDDMPVWDLDALLHGVSNLVWGTATGE